MKKKEKAKEVKEVKKNKKAEDEMRNVGRGWLIGEMEREGEREREEFEEEGRDWETRGRKEIN